MDVGKRGAYFAQALLLAELAGTAGPAARAGQHSGRSLEAGHDVAQRHLARVPRKVVASRLAPDASEYAAVFQFEQDTLQKPLRDMLVAGDGA